MKHAIAWLALMSFILPAHANEAKRAAHDAYKQERADWKSNGQVPPSPRRNPKQN